MFNFQLFKEAKYDSSPTKKAFNYQLLQKSLISELESVTDSECTRLQILTSIVPDSSRREVIKLVDKGDRLQTRDPLFHQKLSQWINSSHEDIPMASSVATLMLIGSQNDNDYAWLATGEALGHLLLRARIDDVKVSCLNRPIQVPELRSEGYAERNRVCKHYFPIVAIYKFHYIYATNKLN